MTARAFGAPPPEVIAARKARKARLISGGNLLELAFSFAIVALVVLEQWAATLGIVAGMTIVLTAWSRLRPAVSVSWATKSVLLPALLFGFAVLALALGLTPFGVGGPNPLWEDVRAPGVSAVDTQVGWAGLLCFMGLGLLFALARNLQHLVGRSVWFMSGLMIAGGLIAAGELLSELGLPPFVALWDALGILGYCTLDDRSALVGTTILLALQRLSSVALKSLGGGDGSGRGALSFNNIIAGMTIALGGLDIALTASLAVQALLVMTALLLIGWALFETNVLDIPRQLIVWIVPATAALVLGLTTLIVTHLPNTDTLASASLSTHWQAFQASPWSGYGMGAEQAVGQVFATPASLAALQVYALPPNAYLVWCESGGVLFAAPLVLVLVWVTTSILMRSLHLARRSGTVEGIAGVSLFLLALGFVSPAMASIGIACLWATLLGFGWGGLELRQR